MNRKITMPFFALPAAAAVALAGCSSATEGHPDVPATSAPATSASAAPSPSVAPVVDDATVPATPEVPQYVTPTAADFTVELKILSKHCFGSAGCNIDLRPELSTSLDTSKLDPSVTYDLTFKIKGSDDGPLIDSFEITGDSYRGPSELMTGTANSHAKLTAEVLSVSAQ